MLDCWLLTSIAANHSNDMTIIFTLRIEAVVTVIWINLEIIIIIIYSSFRNCTFDFLRHILCTCRATHFYHLHCLHHNKEQKKLKIWKSRIWSDTVNVLFLCPGEQLKYLNSKKIKRIMKINRIFCAVDCALYYNDHWPQREKQRERKFGWINEWIQKLQKVNDGSETIQLEISVC